MSVNKKAWPLKLIMIYFSRDAQLYVYVHMHVNHLINSDVYKSNKSMKYMDNLLTHLAIQSLLLQ